MVGRPDHPRRLRFESLERRRMLASANFVDVAQSSGLSGLLGGSGEFHAGGMVFTDLNLDGYADLYIIGPTSRGNRLYVNVDDGGGSRTFVRAVGDGGTSYTTGRSTGAVAADYDNDGDLDIYLTNYRDDNILFRNMWQEDHASGVGDPLSLRFVDVTSATDPTPSNPNGDNQHGLGFATYVNPNPLFSTQRLDNSMAAAWADVNRDGWVDLYVGSWDGTNGNPAESDDGRLGERDTLYLNNGDGTFTDITMGLDGGATFDLLVDDGSLEAATPSSTFSNSDWALTAESQSAVFQEATWAASDGDVGVWFQGFRGSAGNPADARLTQVVTATESGDYTLLFDARVEANFAATIDEFRVTISSDGTGGAKTFDILAATTDADFRTYRLDLPGVTAGDSITIAVEMIGAVGLGGAQRSGFVDGIYLRGPGWEQVGGWHYSSGQINDTTLPAEFSGHNALQFADFNNDGWQDLIVATMGGGDVGPNRDMLYLNRGNDSSGDWLGYHMVSYELGFGGEESSDMGVAVADIDNDGDLDYFSTLLPAAHPIWINNLSETGELSFTRTTINNDFSWGANFHDFDNNGRVDLMVGTDINRRSYLHLQELNGSFSEQGVAAGFTTTHTIRGVAVADFDRDGWSDAAHWSWFGANPGIQLYSNQSAAQNTDSHFLTLQLEGDPTLTGAFRSTRDAIGARAYVTADFDGNGTIEADETRLEEVLSGHSNASTTSSLALEFGLGDATTADVRVV
ncbi:MAG: FG-GAP-like repeat-containing protein, partial [Planctomycetota bacterium]